MQDFYNNSENNLIPNNKELKYFRNRNIEFTISSRFIEPDESIERYLNKYFPYIDFSQVESLFGFDEEFVPLYGGRSFSNNGTISALQNKELQENSINISLTLTNHYFDEELYSKTKSLLQKHHKKGNSIVCTNDDLAKRIRADFPLYSLKASLIKDLNSLEKVEKALEIYDYAVIPMEMNDYDDFLDSLPNKERIILFANANCAYNCTVRICYQSISKKLAKNQSSEKSCSKDLLERDQLGQVYFDIKKFYNMGFTYFKLLPNTWQDQQKDESNLITKYSDNLPKLLKTLNISLSITSQQSSQLLFLKSDGETILTSTKSLPSPMGLYSDDEQLIIAIKNQVAVFSKSDDLLLQIKNGDYDNKDKNSIKVSKEILEKKEKRKQELEDLKSADTLYLQRASVVTGTLKVHDLALGEEGIWMVNSVFSCLSLLTPNSSFIARWKPNFISELVPEDRCHLNGMALLDGRPKYVTTFNMGNTKDSWRKGNLNGALIDIDTDEVLLQGLIRPHSPKVYEENIYFCESGLGIVWKYDLKTKEKSEVIKLQGFTRGLRIHQGILFVATSKTRDTKAHGDIPLLSMYQETYAGIWMVNLEDNSLIAYVKFEGEIKQLYDISVIENSCMPELLHMDSLLIKELYTFEENIK